MDFFEYANIAMMFSYSVNWLPYLVGGLCYAVVFIFSAVALYTIASREGYKNKWMAFVPFFNTYYIGVCAQKNKCLNMDARKVSMITAILETLLFVGNLLFYIACEILESGNYLQPIINEINGIPFSDYRVDPNLPSNLAWAGWCFENIENYILWWLQLIYLFFEVMVLSCFFQTYAAKRYFIFTITSILFPIQGVLFFVLRNNKGMNYRDYIRREQEKQYRVYREHYNQNNNPYNNSYNNPYNNPYNQNPYSNGDYNQQGGGQSNAGNSAGTYDDPFSEFNDGGSGNSSNSGGDPFDLN